MPRVVSKHSMMPKIIEAIDSRPGEYLSVATIAKMAGCNKKGDLASLPGYMAHLSDKGDLERAKIENTDFGAIRKTVWGYRRANSAPAEKTPETTTHPTITSDPAAWALANPPRGVSARVPSLCNSKRIK